MDRCGYASTHLDDTDGYARGKPLASPNRAHGSVPSGTIECMASQTTEPTYARRLRALLAHLEIDPATFAARTGLTEGYLSRVLSGERGKSELPKLQGKAESVFGVPGRYWSATSDEAAKKTLRSLPQHGGDPMARMIGGQSFGGTVDYRTQLAQLAAERDEPGEIVKGLMRTEAPAGADAVWWFRRYLELRDGLAGK